MAAKKTSKSFELILAHLKKHPKAPFAEVRDAAEKKGFKIYPIAYGRAQALLGIVKVAPYGRGAKHRKKLKVPIATGADQLAMVLQMVKDNEGVAARYRRVLDQIGEIVVETQARLG